MHECTSARRIVEIVHECMPKVWLRWLQDMRHFKAMLRKVNNTFVKDFKVDAEVMEGLREGGRLFHEPATSTIFVGRTA